MFLIRPEYFTEYGRSAVANNGDSYPSDMLVLHVFVFERNTPVLKQSFMVPKSNFSNYADSFTVDGVNYPFKLDISANNPFAFSMDFPYSLAFHSSMLSLFSSGTSSGGSTSVDLTPIQNALSAISSKLDSMSVDLNFGDLNGNFGSFRSG